MLKKIRSFINLIRRGINNIEALHNELKSLNLKVDTLNDIVVEHHLQQRVYNNSKISNKLNQFEYKCYSQNGEDGLIAEIFNRIGVTNKFFVEFGVQDGLETNSTLLLIKGWRGAWIEADDNYCSFIRKKFDGIIRQNMLQLKESFINAENIESIFDELQVPSELDLLSIDIDSNDYWVWRAITKYKPRVVVIEYNAFFPPDVDWIIDYDPKKYWDSTTVFNASLKSLVELAEVKGYTLVACNYTGVNAFFVRNDIVQNKFEKLALKDIYNPIRYRIKGNMGIFKNFEISSKKIR